MLKPCVIYCAYIYGTHSTDKCRKLKKNNNNQGWTLKIDYGACFLDEAEYVVCLCVLHHSYLTISGGTANSYFRGTELELAPPRLQSAGGGLYAWGWLSQ